MTVAAIPFTFVIDGGDWVDHANHLRIRAYGGPDYSCRIAIEPTKGPFANRFPIEKSAYFVFIHAESDVPPGVRRLDGVWAHQPFARDFPGRTEALLDVTIPLIAPTSAFSFPHPLPDVEICIPDKLRPLLAQRGSYARHRDEPGTDAYRQANPTKEDVARYKAAAAATRAAADRQDV